MLFRCKVHLSHARIIPNDNRYFGRSDQKKIKILDGHRLRIPPPGTHTHTQTGGQVENIMHRRPIRWAADKNQR